MARPHPGPLPQEREKRLPVVDEFDALNRRGERGSVNAAKEIGYFRRRSFALPLLGERAGVRASFVSISFGHGVQEILTRSNLWNNWDDSFILAFTL